MKVYVAGEDRSEDLGAELEAAAEALARGGAPRGVLPTHVSAMSLRHATTEQEYLDELIRLLWYRTGIETSPAHVPHNGTRRSRLLAWLRLAAWKFLRYPFDHTAYQQNAVNTQLAAALEFLRRQDSGELAALRERVAELEHALRTRRSDAS